MIGFKEQVRKDVKGVFINFAEFADWHNLSFTSAHKEPL
ncbi:hypothetical protein SAMN05720761_11479 [Fibrobacter sp. UWCM]|nr:hypothetical protein SAMN05720761_11479 [Fibrobacter sp. UWCM]